MQGSKRRVQKYIGQQFEKWTVLGPVPTTERRNRWAVQCECGVIQFIISACLFGTGVNKSSGCRSCSKSHYSNSGVVPGFYFTELKAGAVKGNRNLIVEVTIEDLCNLWENQQGKCALTGRLLVLSKRSYVERGTASVDRIDSSVGYIKSNVQWVHKDVNQMKMELDQEYFIQLCREVASVHPFA